MTGVPILLNTSLNVMGEPIVETPDDALWTLLYTGLDACMIESQLVRKPPGWRSVLQLYPRIISTAVHITYEGATKPILEAVGKVVADVQTPWGPVRRPLNDRWVDHTLLRIMNTIDGMKSGFAIASTLGLPEDVVQYRIGELRRARVIVCSGQPQPVCHSVEASDGAGSQ